MNIRDGTCVQFTVFDESIDSLLKKVDICSTLQDHSVEFVMYEYGSSPPGIRDARSLHTNGKLMSSTFDSTSRNVESLYDELSKNGNFDGDEMSKLSEVFNWIHSKTSEYSQAKNDKVQSSSTGSPNLSPIYRNDDNESDRSYYQDTIDDEFAVPTSDLIQPLHNSLLDFFDEYVDQRSAVDGSDGTNLNHEWPSFNLDSHCNLSSVVRDELHAFDKAFCDPDAEGFTHVTVIKSSGSFPENDLEISNMTSDDHMDNVCVEQHNISTPVDSFKIDALRISSGIDESLAARNYSGYNLDPEAHLAISSIVETLVYRVVTSTDCYVPPDDSNISVAEHFSREGNPASTTFLHNWIGNTMEPDIEDASYLSTDSRFRKHENADDDCLSAPSLANPSSVLFDDCNTSFASLDDYVELLEEMGEDNTCLNKRKSKKRRNCFTKRRQPGPVECRFPGCGKFVRLRVYTIKRHALLHVDSKSSCTLCNFKAKRIKSIVAHHRRKHASIRFTADHIRKGARQENLRDLVHKCFPIEKVSIL